MPPHVQNSSDDPALEAYLLGVVDYESCLALQQRLVYEASGRGDGQISLLICEHPETITIGRGGSRWDIRIDEHELTSRQIPVQWVSRGGGCLFHAPGQVAVYSIVPLAQRGYSVGEYLRRLQAVLLATLEDVGIRSQVRTGRFGLWGRTGQLAAMGVAVRNWTAYHGAFINVSPALQVFRNVRTDSREASTMSSLVVEGQKPVRMASVRSALVQRFAEVFGCSRHHLYSTHPLLSRRSRITSESARAS